jgi:hypothetical protein
MRHTSRVTADAAKILEGHREGSGPSSGGTSQNRAAKTAPPNLVAKRASHEDLDGAM